MTGNLDMGDNNITNIKQLGLGILSPTSELDIRTIGGTNGVTVHLGYGEHGLYISGIDPNEATFAVGANPNYSTGKIDYWTARHTSANIIHADDGTMKFYADTSLTAGNQFTPTTIFSYDVDSVDVAKNLDMGNFNITNVQQMGIGTSTPDELLEVVGNIHLDDNYKILFGTGKDSSIYYNTSDMVINPKEVGAGSLFVTGNLHAYENITTNGLIGIGTNTPTALLHLVGGANAYQVQEKATNDEFAPGFQLKKARGSVGSEAIIQNNDILYGINAYGHDGNDYKEVGRLRFTVDGAPGADDIPTRFEVYTSKDGTVSPALKFAVDDNGRILHTTNNEWYSGTSSGAVVVGLIQIDSNDNTIINAKNAEEIRFSIGVGDTKATIYDSGKFNVSQGGIGATAYYAGDGTQGFTGTCNAPTSITVKDGLITGCA